MTMDAGFVILWDFKLKKKDAAALTFVKFDLSS